MNWRDKSAISIAGGKGGIGKSCLATNLGVALAQQGRRVVLVDADVGAANLHTMVGISYPRRTLADFLKDSRAKLEDALIETSYQNLRLLSTASDILSVVSPTYKMNQRLFGALQTLDTDVIIFDIAAGTHHRAIDFFALAPVGIIVLELLPTALENAFLFTKNLLFRHLLRMFYHDVEMKRFIQNRLAPESGTALQFHQLLDEVEAQAPEKVKVFREYFAPTRYNMCLVANSVRDTSQQQMLERFAKIIKRYLGLSPHILGSLPYEPSMDSAIIQRTPFVVKYPQSGYMKGIQSIIGSIPFGVSAR